MRYGAAVSTAVVSDWVGSGIGAMALGVAVWALVHSRGQRRASDRSAEASEKAARAAERSAVAAESSAASAERSAWSSADLATIESSRRDDEVAQARRRRVSWELERVGAAVYYLRNGGTEAANGVVGTARAPQRLDCRAFPPQNRVGSGEGIQFFRSGNLIFATELVVTWRHEPDGQGEEGRLILLFGT